MNNKLVEEYRLCENTKQNYKYSEKKFRDYLKSKHHECFNENDEYIFPLDVDAHILPFLENLAKEDSNGCILTSTTINGYINAIKNIHTERNIKMADEVTLKLKNWFTSYKKKVKILKNDNKMKSKEGKNPFSVEIYKLLAAISLSSCLKHWSAIIHCFLVMCWNLFAR
ncbi:MAG: hypothetical protein FD136_1914 [Chitinophagaceae bacterium]|nr:MAG: hypothetical protein FD136_1914 [Chitinophagaceae bacterium]